MRYAHDLSRCYEAISSLLSAEEAAPPISQLAEWEARQAQRAALLTRVGHLEQAVAEVQRRLAALPTLAGREHLYWAQALLAFPNLAFLEVDTDGLHADADILRIVLVDQAGTLLYDQVLQPRRPVTPKIAYLTGIAPERLSQAPTLVEVWQEVRAVFAGRYVLSFNLEFDQGKLSESATRYDVPELPLLGACLMLRAQDYYGASYYPKLSDLCERLGAPLPPHPQQDALDRAGGQVHLLRMMAQGITQAPVAWSAFTTTEQADPSRDPFLPDFPDENE